MKNSEQSAFPAPDTIHPETGQRFEPLCAGLTKREYFAGQIMAALASIPNTGKNQHRLAEHAVSAADALLAELAKPEQP